jgi:hypothetical protein
MKVDNLSNLSVRLKDVEAEHVEGDEAGMRDARLAVVNALEQYRRSRYRLGQKLSAYKAFYGVTRGWIAAAKVIAGVMGCDERTIRRIVEDFERVSDVPAVVIKALEQAGIDPAARRNAFIISKILRMPKNTLEASPEAAVLHTVKSAKSATTFADAPFCQVVSSLDREEHRRLAVRKKVRSAVKALPIERKLYELVAAIEEEMYSEWGMLEPITLTIRPHRPESHKEDHAEQAAAA